MRESGAHQRISLHPHRWRCLSFVGDALTVLCVERFGRRRLISINCQQFAHLRRLARSEQLRRANSTLGGTGGTGGTLQYPRASLSVPVP